MPIWAVIASLAGAGAFGGLINALLFTDGLILSRFEQLPDERWVWKPGFVGNVAIGAVTAFVLAGLYTPLGTVSLGGTHPANDATLTISGLAGALLSGIGGARLLTAEIHRRYEAATIQDLRASIQNLVQAAGVNAPADPGNSGDHG